MSLYYEIVCDICARTYPLLGETPTEGRRAARTQGWRRLHIGRRLIDSCEGVTEGLDGSLSRRHTAEWHGREIRKLRALTDSAGDVE